MWPASTFPPWHPGSPAESRVPRAKSCLSVRGFDLESQGSTPLPQKRVSSRVSGLGPAMRALTPRTGKRVQRHGPFWQSLSNRPPWFCGTGKLTGDKLHGFCSSPCPISDGIAREVPGTLAEIPPNCVCSLARVPRSHRNQLSPKPEPTMGLPG